MAVLCSLLFGGQTNHRHDVFKFIVFGICTLHLILFVCVVFPADDERTCVFDSSYSFALFVISLNFGPVSISAR